MAAKKRPQMTARQVSELYGIPNRTARDWLDAGMPQVVGKEQEEWVKHRQSTGKNRPKGILAGVESKELLDLAERKLYEDIRYRRLKSRREIIAIEREKGRLISLADAQQTYGNFVSMVNTRLRSIGRSICDFLIHLEDPREAERIVQDEINKALDVLANDDGIVLQESMQKTRRTRKSNRKPVGRKKPRAD